MKLLLPPAFLAFVLVLPSNGQPPAKDGGGPGREPDPALWTTKLSVTPTPAPRPALRYELLPPTRDRLAGNAAVGYLRAATVRPAWPKDAKQAKEQDEQFEQWSTLPVDQLPTAKMEPALQKYAEMLTELDEAARRRTCDWETDAAPLASVEDVSRYIGRHLPAVQANREMIRILSLKCRMELGEKKFPAALRTLQTGLQLGKHVGEGGLLIDFLVGQALTGVMVGRLDDWVGRADSPNLYWTLAALPRPLVNARPALDAEARLQHSILPGLKDLERGPVSEEAALNALSGWLKANDEPGGGVANFARNLGAAAVAAARGPAAKKDLIARGVAKADVDAMPAAQAAILQSIYRQRDLWDDQVKLFSLPPHQAFPLMERLEQQVKKTRAEAKDDVLFAVMSLVFPAGQKVHFAQARLERRLALLRALEAVRLQVAFDGGKVPAALAAVTIVPVPDDPFTGKPFEYAAKADGFTLTAPRLKLDQPNIGEHVYEVTVRK